MFLRAQSFLFFFYGFIVGVFIIAHSNSISPVDESPSVARAGVSNATISAVKCTNDATGSKLGKKVFGHVHMAKTGGTTLNGVIALNYEHVCGHKGYSFDYFQANKRFNASTSWENVRDSVSDYKNGSGGPWNRGRIPIQLMDEIGYEDCDWVSSENNAQFWHRFDKWHRTMELHVPCRDPIDHLLSQCNHRGLRLSCDVDSIEDEIEKCLVYPDRFDGDLTNATIYPNLSVKCFAFERSFTDYLSFINENLESKSISSEYAKRETNNKREKENECLRENEKVNKIVFDLLVTKYDYYSFCTSCLGSEDDLLKRK